jgi:hypothetical protein
MLEYVWDTGSTQADIAVRLRSPRPDGDLTSRLGDWAYGERVTDPMRIDIGRAVPPAMRPQPIDIHFPQDGVARSQTFVFDPTGIAFRLYDIDLLGVEARYSEAGNGPGAEKTMIFREGDREKSWNLQIRYPSTGVAKYRISVYRGGKKIATSDFIPIRLLGFNFSIPQHDIYMSDAIKMCIGSPRKD